MTTVKLPSRIVRPRQLAEVPRSEYGGIAAPRQPEDTGSRLGFLKRLRKGSDTVATVAPGRKQVMQFNAAAWLRVSTAPGIAVSLVLHYRDESGDFCAVVDEVKTTESGTVMLSGSAEIEFRGQIEFLQAAVSGLSGGDTILVDELYVQRQLPANQTPERKSA